MFCLRKGSGKTAGNFLRLEVKLSRQCLKRNGSSGDSQMIQFRPEKPPAYQKKKREKEKKNTTPSIFTARNRTIQSRIF